MWPALNGFFLNCLRLKCPVVGEGDIYYSGWHVHIVISLFRNLTRSLGNVLEKTNSSSASPTPSPPQSPTPTKHSAPITTTTSTTASHHSRPHTPPTPSPRPSPSSSPTLPHSVPLSPTGSKRHNYINCTPNIDTEEEGVARSRTVLTPKNKRPRPLPRSPFV